MQDINVDIKTGTVTRDADLKFIPKGQGEATALIKFGIAVHGYNGAVSFDNVEMWGKEAEKIADKILKGVRVLVKGEGINQTFKGQSGADVARHVIKADIVEVLPKIQKEQPPQQKEEFTEESEGEGVDIGSIFGGK